VWHFPIENCTLEAQALLDAVLRALDEFACGRAADDDLTMIVVRVS
jgi:serine phosphatase RsbU (regulator of sigma subunit)